MSDAQARLDHLTAVCRAFLEEKPDTIRYRLLRQMMHEAVGAPQRTVLSAENAKRFVEILENAEPTPTLVEAAKRYKHRHKGE